MRASSLSNAKVISLINRFFVPVYVSNEDYAKNGPAPAEEKAERNRIYQEALKAKLSTGTVHVYIVNTDGHPIDSLHVAQASKVDAMTAMLERVVEKLGTPAGEPLVKPQPQSTPPKTDADALLLHLTARNLRREGNEWAPVKPKLGETRSAGWGSYAVEDWIELKRAAWTKLLPAAEVKVGTSWEMNPEAAACNEVTGPRQLCHGSVSRARPHGCVSRARPHG